MIKDSPTMRDGVGAPDLPQACLVVNNETRKFAVAVRGGKFVCPLPAGYAGPGLELAVINGGQIIAVHPDHPPLVIDPEHGTTRLL